MSLCERMTYDKYLILNMVRTFFYLNKIFSRIFKDANIWVDSDIGYTSTGQDLDVQVYASTEIFLKGPSITNVSTLYICVQIDQ